MLASLTPQESMRASTALAAQQQLQQQQLYQRQQLQMSQVRVWLATGWLWEESGKGWGGGGGVTWQANVALLQTRGELLFWVFVFGCGCRDLCLRSTVTLLAFLHCIWCRRPS